MGMPRPTNPIGNVGQQGNDLTDVNMRRLMAKIGAKIGAVHANTLGRPFNIVFIGNSETEGMGIGLEDPVNKRFAGRLQQWADAITQRPMGHGMIQSATYDWGNGKYVIDNGGIYDTPSLWFRSPLAGSLIGFGSTMIMTNTNDAEATFDFSSTGVAVQVPTLGADIAGSLVVSIDGTPVDTISLAYTGVTYKPTIHEYTGLADTNHTLTLKSVVSAGKYAAYMGVMELTGNNGIWIHALGVNGATSHAWANNAWTHNTPLDSIDVLGTYCGGIDIVFLMLGGNDILQDFTKAQYLTNMTTIVQHFSSTGIPVVGFGCGTFDESYETVPFGMNAVYADWLSGFKAICEANGGAYLDFLPDIFGGNDWTQELWTACGYNADALHYNPSGHAYQAILFAQSSPFKELLNIG